MMSRLVIQQFTFGPSEIYARPPPLALSDSPADFLTALSEDVWSTNTNTITQDPQSRNRRMSSSFSRVSYSDQPPRNRRMSSSFSRVSYAVHDDAEDEEIRTALEGKSQDGIVGVLFGKSVKEQIGSTWFWSVNNSTYSPISMRPSWTDSKGLWSSWSSSRCEMFPRRPQEERGSLCHSHETDMAGQESTGIWRQSTPN